MPSSPLGRASVLLLLGAIVLMFLSTAMLENAELTIGNVNIIGLVSVLALLAALVPGAIALIRDRERSWAVWVSTLLPAVILGFEVLSWIIPGE